MSRYGACILDAEGLRLTSEEKALFSKSRPFGFILFARNIDTPDQIRALCAEMREAAGHNAPILIDQEGGRVQRLRAPLWREWLPPLDHVVAAGDAAVEAMYIRSRIMAHELLDLGIDSNCAPLIDVACDKTHPFLKNRCYGTDPAQVAAIGRAVADGHLDGGVLPVAKHIPGHGRAAADSHFDLPVVNAPRSELDTVDFAPFKALNDLPMGMTAHLVYEAVDQRPATTSPIMMDIIRNQIGFDGLIMTDDISMKALKGSLADLSSASLDAGCDVILHCNGTLTERAEVAEASGEMTEIAEVRAERALSARKASQEVDIAAIEAKLEALSNRRADG
ncbi:Beta-hexosaminidase [Roseovarius albus]|uniref:beta-N-acetylhexosaminidase n=1 Tax=Roseovarius albus TaxID=1247867 RepID=A0A1X6YCK9_9RHOB|nr:beta-N-acetylhexosaminidase [Roseovarius albus]SLN16765.1 Beta-hexosaminidase [Roseovarius albus]